MRSALWTMVLVLLVAAGPAAGGTVRKDGVDGVPALVWRADRVTLSLRHALTLSPAGRSLSVGRAEGIWARSPGARYVALVSSAEGLTIVDLRTMRVSWRVPRGFVTSALEWVSPRRLVLFEHRAVLEVDPVARRIVGRAGFEGAVLQVARWRESVVALVSADAGRIEPARLLAVGPGPRLRSVELPGVLAGVDGGENNQGPWRTATPALAVDPEGRALVAGGGRISTVDLASLAVTADDPVRTPQKVAAGPVRSAAWAGGALAVSGYDLAVTRDAAGVDAVRGTPYGLRYVRAGRVQLVDPAATHVKAAGGLVLAYGNEWWRGAAPGRGLAAYDAAGALRWRALPDAAVESVTIVGRRAYALAQGRWHVVDLTTGRVLASPPAPASLLLLGR